MERIEESTKTDNPFYDNHLFSKTDLERAKITWRDEMWLWLFPTFVQISPSENWVFHYKIVNGKYYIMKSEPFNPQPPASGLNAE